MPTATDVTNCARKQGKHYYITETPHSTTRIWVSKVVLEDRAVLEVLDKSSIWGGIDAYNDHYASWEFSDVPMKHFGAYLLELFGYVRLTDEEATRIM